jgi:stress-induced morphogen
VSAALMQSMQAKIQEALAAQSVSVQDVYGDGRHVSIDVVSDAFDGKNAVQRQRMVYKVRTSLAGL